MNDGSNLFDLAVKANSKSCRSPDHQASRPSVVSHSTRPTIFDNFVISGFTIPVQLSRNSLWSTIPASTRLASALRKHRKHAVPYSWLSSPLHLRRLNLRRLKPISLNLISVRVEANMTPLRGWSAWMNILAQPYPTSIIRNSGASQNTSVQRFWWWKGPSMSLCRVIAFRCVTGRARRNGMIPPKGTSSSMWASSIWSGNWESRSCSSKEMLFVLFVFAGFDVPHMTFQVASHKILRKLKDRSVDWGDGVDCGRDRCRLNLPAMNGMNIEMSSGLSQLHCTLTIVDVGNSSWANRAVTQGIGSIRVSFSS